MTLPGFRGRGTIHIDIFATKGELAQTEFLLDLIKISNGNMSNQKSIG